MLLKIFLVIFGFCYTHRNTDASHQTSSLSAYEITIPQLLTDRHKRHADRHLSEQEQWQDQISYSVQMDGEVYTLKLDRNKELLTKDFVQYVYDKDGKVEASQPKIQIHCHYHGFVEGVANSSVLLSTCSGLRGILFIAEKGYGIEPLEASLKFEHLIYQLPHLQTEPILCGVPHHGEPVDGDPKHSSNELHLTQHLRKKRAILPTTRYIELILVIDNKKYNLHQKNTTSVQLQMVELVNIVNGMYISLNIRVILTALVIWKDENLIDVTGSAGEVLGRFIKWRQNVLVPQKKHDSGHLILGEGQYSGVLGMAFVGTVCSPSLGGGIDVFSSNNVASAATILAHELGHNLGMNHDDRPNCNCPTSSCIMAAHASGASNFSKCSEDDFVALIERGKGICLQNAPEPGDQYSPAACGNSILDKGEDCDCGLPKDCKDPCCNAATCTLASGSQCAYGLCCQNCKFLSAGIVCRRAGNACDLPEYCNGSSQFCKPDVFIQNGYLCDNSTSYCYEGECSSYNDLCRSFFGSTSKRAPDVCFQHANMKGDRFGNCGRVGTNFKKCSLSNSLCGKVQCVEGTVIPYDADTSTSNINGISCRNADFKLGTDVMDPSYVATGTGCAKGKACIDFECVSAGRLGFDCDIEGKCHNHGICNSNKNCHCDPGWAPPNCDTSGYGGSIDSGPPHQDTSVRDGLLIFFLLVVPVLCFIAFLLYCFRNKIKSAWRRRDVKHTYKIRIIIYCLFLLFFQVISTQNTRRYENAPSTRPPAFTGGNQSANPAYPQVPQKPAVPPRPTVPPRL
uniref:Disintegrin and metalloproteinase domain-containing protein 9-like n=1 Tax=Callorhinchus milii TaxID=7868 RepID=A0A4W3HKC6_CALMI